MIGQEGAGGATLAQMRSTLFLRHKKKVAKVRMQYYAGLWSSGTKRLGNESNSRRFEPLGITLYIKRYELVRSYTHSC